jgi:4-hydroxythreonine-4-phosphate dehydrogenase
MFIALYTDHIHLKNVTKMIKTKKLTQFLLTLASSLNSSKIGVLGLNPHAGDFGVLGKEETKIIKAIQNANETLGEEKFLGPLVPDTAFTPHNLKNYTHYVAMYHDQGLIPLKTLYFDQSINVTLGLPIIRTSVDHGTAFDKAYNNSDISLISYKNAIIYALFGQNQNC